MDRPWAVDAKGWLKLDIGASAGARDEVNGLGPVSADGPKDAGDGMRKAREDPLGRKEGHMGRRKEGDEAGSAGPRH